MTVLNEKVMLNAVVGFLVQDGQVLLGIKTRNIGAGRFNGYGGGIEEGESSAAAMIREAHEESGIILSESGLKKMAVINVHNTRVNGETFVCKLHVYLVQEWSGEPWESLEMINLRWFDFSRLPENMLPGDSQWLPRILKGTKLLGTIHYGPFQKTLLQPVQVWAVKSLSQD